MVSKTLGKDESGQSPYFLSLDSNPQNRVGFDPDLAWAEPFPDPVLIAHMDPVHGDWKIADASSVFAREFGWDREAIRGQPLDVLCGPKSERALLRDVRARLALGQAWRGSTWTYRVDGSSVFTQWTASPFGPRGAPTSDRALIVLRDITLEHETNGALRSAWQVIQGFTDLPVAFVRADQNGRVQESFGESWVTLAFDSEHTIGENLFDIAPDYADHFRLALEGGSAEFTAEGISKGRGSWAHRVRLSFDHERDGGVISHSFDISTLQDEQRRNTYLARYEEESGLLQRSALIEEIGEILASNSSRVAVVVASCADLETLFGVLAHEEATALLNAISRRLKHLSTSRDHAARMGMGLFALIITAADEEALNAEVHRVADEIRQPYHVHGHEHVLTLSVGFAIDEQADRRPDVLLRAAKIARLRSSQLGHDGTATYDRTYAATLREQRQLAEDLRIALEHGELSLAFQPKLNLKSGKVLGVEALSRWTHPKRGYVRPDHFIAVAEQNGLIVKLGEWVAEEAARIQKMWRQAGLELCCAINVSPVQFRRARRANDVAACVLRAAEAHGLPPSAFEIEVTESGLADEATVNGLAVCREAGFGVAVDDFCKEYAAIGVLSRVAATHVKIDRQFVDSMTESKASEQVLEKIIQIGQVMGLKVTAEGVETTEQLQMLRNFGCDEIQGYVFARPMRAEEIPGFVSAAGKYQV